MATIGPKTCNFSESINILTICQLRNPVKMAKIYTTFIVYMLNTSQTIIDSLYLKM